MSFDERPDDLARFPLAFFSFVKLVDNTPENHREYNLWHLMDHRPENLALPGVAWGERWSRIPGVDENHSATEPLSTVDYAAMYLFNDPVDVSVTEWEQLGTDSFEWGRGPLIPGVERPFLGFFRPVKGYAAASALVSAEVLPFRPNQGVHLTLTRFDEAHGAVAHGHHMNEDRILMPELLELPGVAGAWTFSFSHHQNVTMRPRAIPDDSVGSMRIRLVYMDGDPQSTTDQIRDAGRVFGYGRDGSGVQTLADISLGSIVPFAE